jgi:nucleoside-diphosphate-sugar epimerase
MEQHVLVAGATGLVGRAAMEHFARKGVRTTAVSRRRPWDTYGAQWLSADLADEAACADALGRLADVTQVVFAALHEEADLVAGWLEDRHVRRNGDMLRNLVEIVDRASPTLRNVTILQGPKAYGVHVGRMRPGAREDRDERYEVPNFYWAQENYLKAKQRGRPWSWTVIRPALVVGMAIGGAMNLVAALGVYGALLQRRGEPLHYPGGAGALLEATDTDLMARTFDWVGASPEATNQTFNVTNGELFSLKELWPDIARALGMEVGDDIPLGFADELPKAAAEWDAIRVEHGLIAPPMDAFIGQSFQFADFVLARTLRTAPQSAAMSSIKIRRAGFNDTLYSDEMFAKWFARYQAERLLPPPTHSD